MDMWSGACSTCHGHIIVAHDAVFPEATPAAVSPEVAADAAEPPEVAVLSLIPCMNPHPALSQLWRPSESSSCQVTAMEAV